MPTITSLVALYSLLGLMAVFGITYRLKDLRTALITMLIALVILGLCYLLAIYFISSAMG